MSRPSAVSVKVPATTANLGPGFDSIGAALSLYNQFHVAVLADLPAGTCKISASGLEAERVQTDSENLVYRSFKAVYDKLSQPVPAVEIEIYLGIPLARGLGSSATAIAAGVVAGNALCGSVLSQQELLQLAITLEGHPDNVVPALLGGCKLAATSGVNQEHWAIADVPWHESIIPIVAIPDFELSTTEARGVLPPTYSRADTIFNVSHFGLLLRGLQTGEATWLKAALHDRIHQPYRKALITSFGDVEAAAASAGAYGLVISGAGPTLLTLANRQDSQSVQSAMTSAWAAHGVPALVMSLQLDHRGTLLDQQPCFQAA
jgi:homoserine kinase